MSEKRLFVAVDISDAAREAISRVCRGIPEYRWTRRDQLHLTLRFIGNINSAYIPELCSALSDIEFSKLQLTMTGTGFFRPSIFFLDLEQSPSLEALKRKVDSVFGRSFKYAKGAKGFCPPYYLVQIQAPPESA